MDTLALTILILYAVIALVVFLVLFVVSCYVYKGSGTGLKFYYWFENHASWVGMCSLFWFIGIPVLLFIGLLNLILRKFDIKPFDIFE